MFIDRSPGWPFLAALGVAAFLGLAWHGVATPYTEAWVFVVLVWGGFAVVWLIWFGAAMWEARHMLTADRLMRWLPAPLILFGLVSALTVDAPFRARFALSEPSLEQYAMRLASGKEPGPGCEQVGLYRVCGNYSGEAEAIPGGARFLVHDWPWAASRGFMWLPEGKVPIDNMDDQYEHITGPWYGWKGWDGW
ncbi:hypothetical protein [Nonomuraea insulae]|uniref:DUF1109 domain-containing protein n=1 Tax=Nonomuraea insulae TaxID=1616787 RepID=A0ABW1CTL6_9ACTN